MSNKRAQVLEKVGACSGKPSSFTAADRSRLDARLRPLFVKNAAGEVAAVKWRFNGWAKYENHLRDEAAGRHSRLAGVSLAARSGARRRQHRCQRRRAAADHRRMPAQPDSGAQSGLDAREIEAALSDYLGIDRVLWLRNGIAGDDTHGHIDDLARFTDAESVVIVSEDDPPTPTMRRCAKTGRF
jgi:agmatine deiminase